MVKEVTYKNHLIRINYDSDVEESPRAMDEDLGVLLTFHRRVDFTDKYAPKIDTKQFASLEDIKKYLIKEHGAIVILPVYMLDHSGISLSTTPFNDPWDSGQLGFIYTTRERILDGFGQKRLSKILKENAVSLLEAEIKRLSQYASGEVYAYVIDPESDADLNDKHDLRGGNFYDVEYAVNCAKNEVDGLAAWDEEQEFIKNIPEHDLPKYVNHTWKYTNSEDTFKNRLKGVNDGTNN